MKFFIFLLLTTLVASLTALPILNRDLSTSGGLNLLSDGVILHQTTPKASSHNPHQQHELHTTEAHEEPHSGRSEFKHQYQNLVTRKFAKLLQKLGKSKIIKKIGEAFGNFDWRPEWQKKLSAKEYMKLGSKCRPSKTKPKCWTRN